MILSSGLWVPSLWSGPGSSPRSYLRRTREGLPLADFIAWWKADAIEGLSDGDRIATWEDSGTNNYDLTQATVGKRPYYETNEINGLPAVRFNSAETTYLTSTFTYASPVAITIVCKRDAADSDFGTVLNGDDTLELSLAFDTGANTTTVYGIEIFGGATVAGTHPGSVRDWTYYTLSFPAASGTVQLWANGTSLGTATAAGRSSTFLRLGARQSEAAPFKGYIAECIAYNTIDNRSIIESYIAGKYAL